MPEQPQVERASELNLPKGNDVCDVSIINSTCDIVVPPSTLIEPQIEGHEYLNLPTYAFYIKNRRTGKQVLFDMGSRTDWQNLVPSVVDTLNHRIPGLKIEKEVPGKVPAEISAKYAADLVLQTSSKPAASISTTSKPSS